ncbi:MAG: hypothetical protein ACOYYS_18130 [Chloroflexota bacterium]
MKDIFTTIGKVLGWCFAATVILYTSLLTWQLAGRIVPGNPVAQAMTLVLFDVAALVWFIQFITQARGTLQWALSAIGFLVGLGGAIIMAGGELVLGQQLVQIEDPTQIGWVLLSTVVVAALAHATLTYFFHATDPAVKNRIENAQEVSKAVERAYADARSEIARNVDSLVAGLRDSVLYEAERQIAASTAMHIRNGHRLEAKIGETLRGGEVVEAQTKGAALTPHRPRIRWPWRRGDKHQARIEPAEQPQPTADPALTAAVLAALAQFQAEQPAPIHGKNGRLPESDPPAGDAAETAGLPPLPPAPTVDER